MGINKYGDVAHPSLRDKMGASTQLVVVVVLVAALASRAQGLDEEMAELAKMVREECAGETGVDIALVERVNAGAELADVPDAVLKCYIKCTMETAGMFSDGAVDVEAVLALLPDDLRRKNEASIRACGTQRGADPCDTAYRSQLCWQQANKADYFLI